MSTSRVLRHTLSNLTKTAVAILDDGRGPVAVGTLPSMAATPEVPDRSTDGPTDPGQPVCFAASPLVDSDLTQLKSYAQDSATDGGWRAFSCRFDSGRVDRVAFRAPSDPDEEHLLGFLSVVWPVLRQDCLQEIADTQKGAADQAMLWLISKKMDVAVFVMNAQGLMLRCNTAAKNMLDQGKVLKRTRQGIACNGDVQTRMLRDAIAECALTDPEHADAVAFLAPPDSDVSGPVTRIPVTLSRYFHEGAPTSLVTMTLPSPPDSRRVETLAREMGLTQAEARVAALMQLGMSNRDAAQIAGLTEQSLCTYAKRVLNKLNVASRAEVAQMLTWQAQGGPVV